MLESRQSREFLHSANVRHVHAVAHVIEYGECEVRFPGLAPDVTRCFAERGATHDQLAVEAVGQIGFNPLAGEAVGHGFERARESEPVKFQTTNAIQLRRGEHGKRQIIRALALAGEHWLCDVVHRLCFGFGFGFRLRSTAPRSASHSTKTARINWRSAFIACLP